VRARSIALLFAIPRNLDEVESPIPDIVVCAEAHGCPGNFSRPASAE
jgi:hypothetical protein